ncbi:6-pyruvoyl tetrahydropterin synthase family protein [Bacteroidota bacterium]
MTKICLTKQFDFEMAHALWNYDGPCKNIHGHSYKLYVTVIGTPIDDVNHVKNGMLIDFGELKQIVNEVIISRFDHSLVIFEKSKHDLLSKIEQMFEKYEILKFQPTCENLIIYFAELLRKTLPSTVQLYSLKLVETSTSFAEWHLFDNQ